MRFFQLRYAFSFICSGILLLTVSCTKLVEVDPPKTGNNGENVYTDNSTAAAVLTGMYINMASSTLGGPLTANAFSAYAGLSADELNLYGNITLDFDAYYRNALVNTSTPSMWDNLYAVIYKVNGAIEGLSTAEALTPAIKQQLLGEARFMRAYNYLYLVSLYGDVALVASTDYKVNTHISRSPKADVYQFIIQDLLEAQSLLKDDYFGADAITTVSERARPNKWAATALLARAYLYAGQYANAETEASAVINNTALYGLESLDKVFKKESRETIWNIQPVNPAGYSQDASFFVIPASGPDEGRPVYLSPYLVESFEEEDQRKLFWTGIYHDLNSTPSKDYYYAYKYQNNELSSDLTEYQVILRLAEQYLIRSEARIQTGNFAGAAKDLDAIRERAGLPAYAGSLTKDPLMGAMMHERQVELFTEMGHRWIDLKRTGLADIIMPAVTTAKGGSWNANWQYYPIPLREIELNNNLKQNNGY